MPGEDDRTIQAFYDGEYQPGRWLDLRTAPDGMWHLMVCKVDYPAGVNKRLFAPPESFERASRGETVQLHDGDGTVTLQVEGPLLKVTYDINVAGRRYGSFFKLEDYVSLLARLRAARPS